MSAAYSSQTSPDGASSLYIVTCMHRTLYTHTFQTSRSFYLIAVLIPVEVTSRLGTEPATITSVPSVEEESLSSYPRGPGGITAVDPRLFLDHI
jgi:hypothetical protein